MHGINSVKWEVILLKGLKGRLRGTEKKWNERNENIEIIERGGKRMISNRGLIIFALIFALVQTAMVWVVWGCFSIHFALVQSAMVWLVWSSLIIYLNYKVLIVHCVAKSGTLSKSIQCANDYTCSKWSGNVNTSTTEVLMNHINQRFLIHCV